MNPDEVTKRNPDVYVRVFCFRLCRQFIDVSNWKQKTQPLRSKARVTMLVMSDTRGSVILTRSQREIEMLDQIQNLGITHKFETICTGKM